MKKSVLLAAVLCVAATVIAVAPLFGKKYIPTHDGEYHIIRIVEFARMLGAGYLFPRWAPDMNSGYGIPIFTYHYPLPDYVGSFVRLFTRDAVTSFQISMGLGYILIIIGVLLWLATLFGTVPALIGATAAAFVPYLFVDLYVRGTIGELWAMAFLFLSLYAVEKKRYIVLSFTFGLLVLSHNILALLFAPFLIFYCLLRDRKSLLGMAAGVALSAFFWLPALFEQKYVAGLNTVNFREHFVELYQLLIPSWGTQFSGTGNFGQSISFQLGLAPILAVLSAAWILRKEKENHVRKLTLYLFGVLIVCIILMARFSRPFWEIVTPLQLMQYPWRFLSFVVPVTAYMVAYWVKRTKHIWMGIIFALVAVSFAYPYARPVLYAPRNEVYYLARPNFTDGTSSLGNSFSTIWTGWKDTRAESPIISTDGSAVHQMKFAYLDKEFSIDMQKSGIVSVSTLYFPGWMATVDGGHVPITYANDGIIHISVPVGTHDIRVYFTETTTRKIADCVSLLSLVFVLVWGILSVQNTRHHRIRNL